MTAEKKRLIVIGGVAGGTSAASRARRTDKNLDIVIYEKGEYISYGACDEPYYIGGEVPGWENLLVRPPKVFEEKQNIKIRLLHEVTKIDPENKTVEVVNHNTGETFTAPWDKLIIATGAYPTPLPFPGSDLPNVFQLKFLPQAKAIKSFIVNEKPQEAVIIGAGFIAMEMAEALSQNGIHVTILHRSFGPGGQTEPEIAEKIIETLEENNVDYIPNCTIDRIETGTSGNAERVTTNQGDFRTDMIIGAVGVRPSVDIAKAAGVALGPTGAIATNEKQETNIKDIFAAGDCCETVNLVTNTPIFTPLGDIANKQGWAAGENAAGGNALYKGSIASMHFKCFDLEVGMTGLSSFQAEKYFDVITRTIEHRSRAHAQPKGVKIRIKLIADKKSHRLVGAQIAGKEGAAHRINTLAVMVQQNMTVEEINELDFAYAPPFSAVIDPILMAARVLLKDLTA